MKNFKLILKLTLSIIVLSLNVLQCMEDIDRSRKNLSFDKKEKNLKELQPNLWAEVAKFGINKDKILQKTTRKFAIEIPDTSEKEIFKDIDNLRLTNKQIKKDIDNYVRTIGIAKEIQNYNYIQFKYDIMSDLINEIISNAQKKDPALIRDEARINIALALDAKNWAHRKASYDLTFKNQLNTKLGQAIRNNDKPTAVKKILDLGADPFEKVKLITKQNNPYLTIPIYDAFFKESIETIKVILDSLIERSKGVKIDFKIELTPAENRYYGDYSQPLLYEALKLTMRVRDEAFFKNILEITNKLLQLGFDPNQKPSNEPISILEKAQNLLDKEIDQNIYPGTIFNPIKYMENLYLGTKEANLIKSRVKAFIDLLKNGPKIRANFLTKIEKNNKK